MAIRFVDVGAGKAAPDEAALGPRPPARPAPGPGARPAIGDATPASEPVPAGEIPEPDPDMPAPKPRGRRTPEARERGAADASDARAPEASAAPLLDPLLFPEVPAGPKPPPKPRRHRRGFG